MTSLDTLQAKAHNLSLECAKNGDLLDALLYQTMAAHIANSSDDIEEPIHEADAERVWMNAARDARIAIIAEYEDRDSIAKTALASFSAV